MRRLCLLLLAYGLGWGHFLAQEVPKVVSFSQSRSQAKNQNWALAQGPDWRMYVANSEGLLRYDGANWATYYLPDRQIVRAVAADREGRIFCGGFGTFGYWAYDSLGHFQYHSLSEAVFGPHWPREEIWHIVLGDDWVCFQSFATLYFWDGERVQPLRPPGDAPVMFAFRIGDRLLVQARGQGLLELRPDRGLQVLPGTEALAEQAVMAILPAPGGSLLIGTAHQGIFHYAGGRLQPWGQAVAPELARYQLNRGLALQNGDYAFGTILNGLYVLSPEGSLRFHLNQAKGLQNNTILALFQDQDGQLWAGLDKGVDLIALNSPLRYFPDRVGKMGTAYAAAERAGWFYLGTNHGLYARPAGAADFDLVEGTQGQVWELLEVGDELLCGHNAGTFAVQPSGPDWRSEVTGGWVTRPVPGRPDYLIQGTYSGLVVLRQREGRWAFSHRVQGHAEAVRHLAFDPSGALWVAHPYQGLYRLRLDDSLHRVVETQALGPDQGLPDTSNVYLTRLQDQVYVQAGGQYLRWDTNARRLVPAGGMPAPDLPAGNGRLLPGRGESYFWATPYELHYVEGAQVQSLPVALVPGYETVVALPGGRYLLGLDEGYALFDPVTQAGSPAASALAPIITELISLESPARSLRAYPATQRPLALAAAQRNLRFEFALPAYTRPVRYRHRLLGFSPRWSDWERTPYKEYTNLPPGPYTFEVQSSLGPALAQLSFRLAAPWYRQGWAYLLYASLLLALGMLAIRYHRWRLRRHQRRLEIEQARELNRQRMASRNEQLRQDISRKNEELARSTMSLLRKNELLLQLKHELVRARKSAGEAFPHQAYRRLQDIIRQHMASEQDWVTFEEHFRQVHDQFFKRLKADYPELTPGDLRLAAYLRLNLSSKEIAPMLNISIRGVENKRYRLRKKMGLHSDDNLIEVLMKY